MSIRPTVSRPGKECKSKMVTPEKREPLYLRNCHFPTVGDHFLNIILKYSNLTSNQGNRVQLVFNMLRGAFVSKVFNQADRIQLVFDKLYDGFIF
jgi:hypothetical protein